MAIIEQLLSHAMTIKGVILENRLQMECLLYWTGFDVFRL